MFESFKAKRSVERIIDEQFYEKVAYEMEAGQIKVGLWAKATANAEGNEAKIKSLYIQYRVQALVDDIRMVHAADAKDKKVENSQKAIKKKIISKDKKVESPQKTIKKKSKHKENNKMSEEERKSYWTQVRYTLAFVVLIIIIASIGSN